MRQQPNANDKKSLRGNLMSLTEIIALADSIVKGQPMKTPQMEPWELDELMWWIRNINTDLVK